ncbi:MAG: rod shape-determining protein MreC [Deltaproteobacteria bacterium]|nr:rod shape-determining protein MreC [Deltaproteobacteria bacterium]
MREFLARHRPAIVAFLGLTLPLFLLYVHGRTNRKTTIFEAALMKVTAPVQGAASRLLSGVSDMWSGYIALVGVESENEALRDELGRLTTRANRADALELENARLRAMLDFKKERRDLVTVGAHVIGKDVSPFARVLRIALDAGEDARLSEGMPVIDATGLVGRLSRVAGTYAEVLLTVDARSTINVRVQGKGVNGTLTGTASQYNYISRFTYLHRAEPIEVGDLLVTSGHDKVFPPGLPVGVVRSIDERQRDVEYELQVTPAVNFADLDLVHVVTGVVEAEAPVPGDPPPAAPVKPAPPGKPAPGKPTPAAPGAGASPTRGGAP